MKNSLQLQLNQKIGSANRLLKARKFQQAVQEYSNCLVLYEDNRKYNDSISADFEVIILSLRGVAKSYALKFDQAQQDLDRSYILSPYNASTLNRRARFYLNRQRYAQAIQDITKAILYEPENLKHEVLISEIKEAVDKISEEKEKSRLKKLIDCVNKQDEDDEQDEQQYIKFANLRKIDRVSIRPQKRNTVLSFKEDSVIEYQNEENAQRQLGNNKKDIETILKEQDEQLEKLVTNQIEEKLAFYNTPKIISKIKGKSRKSVLRSSFATSSDNASNNSLGQSKQRGSISAISIKNIDGKVIKHDKKEQAIRFRSMASSTFNQFSGIKADSSCIIDADQGQAVRVKVLQTKIQPSNSLKQVNISISHSNKTKGSRKSCLRSSNFSNQKQNSEEQDPIRTQFNGTGSSYNNTARSSFFKLKNIDRAIERKAQSHQKNEDITENNQQNLSQSDDSNQHNVFEQRNQDQILKALENMNNISGGGSFKGGVGKKSILKKGSMAVPTNSKVSAIHTQAQSSWGKSNNKKSVCFKTN